MTLTNFSNKKNDTVVRPSSLKLDTSTQLDKKCRYHKKNRDFDLLPGLNSFYLREWVFQIQETSL